MMSFIRKLCCTRICLFFRGETFHEERVPIRVRSPNLPFLFHILYQFRITTDLSTAPERCSTASSIIFLVTKPSQTTTMHIPSIWRPQTLNHEPIHQQINENAKLSRPRTIQSSNLLHQPFHQGNFRQSKGFAQTILYVLTTTTYQLTVHNVTYLPRILPLEVFNSKHLQLEVNVVGSRVLARVDEIMRRVGCSGSQAALVRCLGNVEAFADELNVFVGGSKSVLGRKDELMAMAQASDARWAAGSPLSEIDGMVIAVKDNFCLGRTTAGSRMLENFEAPYEATLVTRLKQAGAVLIGKTNMDEFGMGSYGANSYFGPSFSPVKLANGARVVAGGSSSGSGAAVASGCAMASIGSDTGGSIRLPAAFCNVVGFKPTYGRISRWGLISYASSLDTPGVLGRTVEDVSAVYDVIAGPDELDSTCLTMDPKVDSFRIEDTIRIGIPVEYDVKELPAQTRQVWKQVSEKFRDRFGAEIVPCSIPSIKDALPAYYVIACAEASSNLARYDGVRYGYRLAGKPNLHEEYTETRTGGFGAEVKKRLLTGSFVLSSDAYDDFYVRATLIREVLRKEFQAAFSEVDVLLTPVSPIAPPSLQDIRKQATVDAYLSDIMTVPSSLAGLPSIALPSFHDTSMQLISKFRDEQKLLSIAKKLE